MSSEPFTAELRFVYRTAFEANAVKLGSSEDSRHTTGLWAVYDFAVAKGVSDAVDNA